jgi:glycosyltransferase involved in cell wall biosynthesis
VRNEPTETTPFGHRRVDRTISVLFALWSGLSDRLHVARARRRRGQRPPTMRVSVPIATYDRIDILLSRTLPALLTQTHADIEVVVVGDGTPHDLWRRLEASVPDGVRVQRLRRRTRYPKSPLERWMVAGWRPRRRAARLSSGEWLLWISDDDILLPDGVERLLDVVREDPRVEAITGSYYVGSARDRVRTPADGISGLGFEASGMPAFLIRADLRKVRWNRHSWRKRWNRPSDYDLMDRLHRAGVRWGSTEAIVAVVPEVEGTGYVGSQGFALEQRRRTAR